MRSTIFIMKTPKFVTLVMMAGALPWLVGCAANNSARTSASPATATAVGDSDGTKVGQYSREPRTAQGDRRVVRSWDTEITPDGRTIRVPVDVEVDSLGRPYPPGTTATSGQKPRGPKR